MMQAYTPSGGVPPDALPSISRISARTWSTWPAALGTTTEGHAAVFERQDLESKERWQSEGMFENFLRLADDEDDQSVLRFANRYGTLHLCEHGVPVAFTNGCGPLPVTHDALSFDGERTDHWRAWARRFAALIEVGRAIAEGRRPIESAVNRMLSGRSDDLTWSGLHEHFPVSETARWLTGRVAVVKGEALKRTQAWYYSRFIDRWLTTQAVVMPTTVPGARLRLEYGPTGLFSALALHAALAATSVIAVVICHNCGRPFAARRRPAKGRRSYCEKRACRVLAAQRDAARHYRARREKRHGRRTSSSVKGEPVGKTSNRTRS